MRKLITLLFLLTPLAFYFSSCGGATGGGNPKLFGRITIAFKAVAGLSAAKRHAHPLADTARILQVSDQSGMVFSLSEARAQIRRIDLQIPDSARCLEFSFDSSIDCDDVNREISIQGPFIYNLLTGTASPPLDTLLIPAGRYTRVDVRLDETRVEDSLLSSSDPLLGNTLILRGHFSYAGDSARLFTIMLKFSEDARFQNPAEILVEENGINHLSVHLDATQWLSGVDILACLKSGDLDTLPSGELLIDENHGTGGCSEIENTVKEAIKNSGRFEEDMETNE